MSLQLLVGTVKAQGLLSPRIQRIVQHHCDAGRIREMAEVVAQVLYDQALGDRSIPEPTGVRTPELLARTQDGVRHIVERYAQRGVLCAKGYYPAAQLVMLMLGKWENDFNNAFQHLDSDHGLPDTDDHNFVTRSTVAAQAIRAVLLKKLPRTPEGDLVLPMSDLEGFCIAAVRTMHAAFTCPEETVHELVHGALPKKEEA